jgi:hypothetical protein
MFFAMTGFASLSVPVDSASTIERTSDKLEAALRHAWLSMRYNHPTLASWVEYNPQSKQLRKVYDSCVSEAEREAWLQATFKPVQTTMSGREWANNDPPAPDLPTLFVIAPGMTEGNAVSRDIVFRSPHEIVDGIGTLQLLANLLRNASEVYAQPETAIPSFGDEHKNLTPSFRTAAGLSLELSPADKQRFDDILADNQSVQSDLPRCILPFKPGALVPGVHKRTSLTLSTTQTTNLLTSCKKASLTPTHAYHAAIALALRDLQPQSPSRTVRYISYSLINNRKDCAPPYNSSSHPVSVMHSVSGRSLVCDMPIPSPPTTPTPSPTDFKSLVTKVHAFYTAIATDKTHLARIPSYWARDTPNLPLETLSPPPGASTPPVPPPDDAPSVSISSMGRLDDIIAHRYGAIAVDDPWITGEELRSGFGLFLGTWKGRLSLSAAYNDAWHVEDEVRAFLERCTRIVTEGMGGFGV